MNLERTLGNLETQDNLGATECPFWDGDFSFPSATAKDRECHPQWLGLPGGAGGSSAG